MSIQKRIKHLYGDKRASAVVFVLAFALIGGVMLLLAQAATPTANIEVEQGTRTAPATVTSDAAASGGQAVRFGTAGSQTWKRPQTKPGGWAWQIQLTGTVNETALDSSTNPNKLYAIDMFDASPALISRLHTKGIYVICYIEGGDWGSSRPDAGDYAQSILGNTIGGFPDERFVNINALNGPAGSTGKTLRQIMTARFDLAASKGCDGIDPDLTDLHIYDTGFTITQDDQVAYNSFLIQTGHARGMGVGIKNGADPPSFTLQMYNAGADWVINEECNQFSECGGYSVFIQGGRPIFQIEYLDNQVVPYNGANGTCARNNTAGFDGIVKDSSWTLSALPRIACRSGN